MIEIPMVSIIIELPFNLDVYVSTQKKGLLRIINKTKLDDQNKSFVTLAFFVLLLYVSLYMVCGK